MKDFKSRAEEIGNEATSVFSLSASDKPWLVKVISEALASAYAEGLEAAAKKICQCNQGDSDLWESCCEHANAIRKLKETA